MTATRVIASALRLGDRCVFLDCDHLLLEAVVIAKTKRVVTVNTVAGHTVSLAVNTRCWCFTLHDTRTSVDQSMCGQSSESDAEGPATTEDDQRKSARAAVNLANIASQRTADLAKQRADLADQRSARASVRASRYCVPTAVGEQVVTTRVAPIGPPGCRLVAPSTSRR